MAFETRFAAVDVTHLLQAILLLEYAQKSSSMNHYFRLLLIRIYRLVGTLSQLIGCDGWTAEQFLPTAAPSLAKPCFQTLKVDHVLHDTLSHFITTRASTFAVGDGIASDPASLLARAGKGTAWFKQTVGAVRPSFEPIALISTEPRFFSGRRATRCRPRQRGLSPSRRHWIIPRSTCQLASASSAAA